jgi:hypothetical protein
MRVLQRLSLKHKKTNNNECITEVLVPTGKERGIASGNLLLFNPQFG